MLDRAAEQSFQKGLELFRVNDTGIQTLALYEAALTSDRRAGNKKGEARYRSYFGLCMVLRGENMREGLALCRQAASQEFYNPQMWLNLGRAESTAFSFLYKYNQYERNSDKGPYKSNNSHQERYFRQWKNHYYFP